MNARLNQLYHKMIEFDAGDPTLIQHFTKVHAYACLIADGENLDAHTREILEAAAIVHDIAIPLCREKYGSDAGNLQEKESPALIEKMFAGTDFDEDFIARISRLAAHHHTYNPIEGIDHQILVEADFIVNAHESNHSPEARQNTLTNIYRTETGKKIYRTMFGM